MPARGASQAASSLRLCAGGKTCPALNAAAVAAFLTPFYKSVVRCGQRSWLQKVGETATPDGTWPVGKLGHGSTTAWFGSQAKGPFPVPAAGTGSSGSVGGGTDWAPWIAFRFISFHASAFVSGGVRGGEMKRFQQTPLQSRIPRSSLAGALMPGPWLAAVTRF
jgi:hypothetical protein